MSDPSPPGNGTGGRQTADPHNENDTQQLPDPAAVVNRKLIKSKRGLDLFEVMERRRRFHYEITCGEQRWVFPLLWSAFLQFDRLAAKLGGNSDE